MNMKLTRKELLDVETAILYLREKTVRDRFGTVDLSMRSRLKDAIDRYSELLRKIKELGDCPVPYTIEIVSE